MSCVGIVGIAYGFNVLYGILGSKEFLSKCCEHIKLSCAGFHDFSDTKLIHFSRISSFAGNLKNNN